MFVKNFVPTQYLQPDAAIFDFADMDNEAGTQLFDEVIGCLQPALSQYTSDPNKQNSIIKVQSDQLGFAKSLSAVVEEAYQWKSQRGLEIVKVAMTGLDYDETTQKLVDRVAEADAFTGARGNTFMQMSAARGIEAAGQNGSGANMAFMGMGMNATGSVMQQVQQPTQAQNIEQNQQVPNTDPYEEITKFKKLLDDGIITQEEFDAKKKSLLGI